MMPLIIKAMTTEPTAVAAGNHRGISSTRFSNVTVKGNPPRPDLAVDVAIFQL
jgi:hypothetical protein